jgi:hypothetical protein
MCFHGVAALFIYAKSTVCVDEAEGRQIKEKQYNCAREKSLSVFITG